MDIKMDFSEMLAGWEDVGWINLAQNRVSCKYGNET
jgi:hypothetical protein